VQHVRAHPEERARQERNVRRLTAGMPLLDTPSHILPLIIGEAHQCRRTSELLLTDTVSISSRSITRLCRAARKDCASPHALHTDDDMQHLVDALVAVARNWAGQWGRRSMSKPRPPSEPRRSSSTQHGPQMQLPGY